mmetsp:Transcript_39252/g.96013  ORF Transcript_39252/g.96013 Transcript_39252/m.96013 type:complete len:248 (-) Transcript_39252:526-1269(-)
MFCSTLASSVRLRRCTGLSLESTSMNAVGVTTAGFTKRSRKKPPMSEQISPRAASVNLARTKSRICLQIHRMPYGTVSTLSVIVSVRRVASATSFAVRAATRSRTAGVAAAVASSTLRATPSGSVPSCCFSSSATCSAYTLLGLISSTSCLSSVISASSGASVALRYDWPGERRVYVVIMRVMAVLARSSEPSDVASSNSRTSTSRNSASSMFSSVASYCEPYSENMTVCSRLSISPSLTRRASAAR